MEMFFIYDYTMLDRGHYFKTTAQILMIGNLLLSPDRLLFPISSKGGVFIHAPSHRQDSTYTSSGALAGMRIA